MGFGVVRVRVVKVIRENQRQVQFFGQPKQVADSAAFDRNPMVHDFDKEVVLADNVTHCRGSCLCTLVIADSNLRLNLARDTTTGCDNSLGMGAQELEIDSRLLIEPFDVRRARHREEVVHTLGRFAQKREVGVRPFARNVVVSPVGPQHWFLVVTTLWREIRLEPNDCLDIAGLGLLPHLERAEQCSVIGHGDGRHVFRDRGIQQAPHACRPVEH